MALKVERVVNGGVHAQKPLGEASRLEPLHFALSSSHRLMRVFCGNVRPQSLLMRTAQSQTPERGGVRAQFVGDQQFRHEALCHEQLAHQPDLGKAVAAIGDFSHRASLPLSLASELSGYPDNALRTKCPSVGR
jgi:hypothetical protein